MKLMLMREGHALIPATETDQEIFEKFRHGTWYKTDARKARNPDHHRKGFALIKLIFDSQEKYLNMEDMLVELKLKAGWYTEHIRSAPSYPILASLETYAKKLPSPIQVVLNRYIKALTKEATVVYIPKSISFADMDQLEFETFYDRIVDIAKNDYNLEQAMEFI